MAEDVTVHNLTKAVQDLTQTLEELLHFGKDAVKDSVDEFLNKKIGKMFGMASAYNKCFERTNVKTKSELERLLHRNMRNREVRHASEELLDVEQDWDNFFKDIDKDIEGDSGDTVQVGSNGPLDLPLQDARTSQPATVRDFLNGKDNVLLILLRHFAWLPWQTHISDVSRAQEEISELDGRVVIISFGEQEGARRWLEDTGATFPMLLDVDRQVYHFFGLYRSVLKVWGVGSLVYYAEAMAAGKVIPKPYENIHDDVIQMGGDFLLDKEGVVRFLYPSKTNKDRPSVGLIREQLQKIQECKDN